MSEQQPLLMEENEKIETIYNHISSLEEKICLCLKESSPAASVEPDSDKQSTPLGQARRELMKRLEVIEVRILDLTNRFTLDI
jgi:hypothetical protein